MRIIRYKKNEATLQLAVVNNESFVFDLPYPDFMSFVHEAEKQGKTVLAFAQEFAANEPVEKYENTILTTPLDAPEVWAAGVTYEKSRDARNFEATEGKLDATTFYDKVYEAERPEIFFKSTAARTVGPGQEVYLRSDSNWQIPEPELGLVINKDGKILGYTAGNDMSCRDIEGENPLYLPQAKMWKNSCSIGPTILLADAVEDPYELTITCRILRQDEKMFEGMAVVNQLKRKLDELVSFLVLDNEIFDGTVLLTGTCIVPPNEFTLKEGDIIEIEISGVGTLRNPVKQLVKKESVAN